jgi:hypothetical protein
MLSRLDWGEKGAIKGGVKPPEVELFSISAQYCMG